MGRTSPKREEVKKRASRAANELTKRLDVEWSRSTGNARSATFFGLMFGCSYHTQVCFEHCNPEKLEASQNPDHCHAWETYENDCGTGITTSAHIRDITHYGAEKVAELEYHYRLALAIEATAKRALKEVRGMLPDLKKGYQAHLQEVKLAEKERVRQIARNRKNGAQAAAQTRRAKKNGTWKSPEEIRQKDGLQNRLNSERARREARDRRERTDFEYLRGRIPATRESMIQEFGTRE
jgi:hypothetical protein